MALIIPAVIVLSPMLYCLGTFARAAMEGNFSRDDLDGHGLAAVGREIAVQYFVWGMLPWDLLRPQWDHHLEEDGPLVVLLPGYTETAAIFRQLQGVLVRRACNFVVYRFDSFDCDLPSEVEHLGRFVEALTSRFPEKDVVLVGHSMGALLGRRYLETHGRDQGYRLVAFGAPHGGTRIAKTALGRCGRQIWSEHDFIRSLEAIPPNDMLNIRTTHDNLIVPRKSAELAGVQELVVDSGWGHNSQLWCPDVLDSVATWIVEGHVQKI